jgi:hypothetical protein
MAEARPARLRVYRPRGERVPSAVKAAIAAARPRDARGYFLPVVGDAVRPATFRGGEDTGVGDLVAENGAEAV